MRGSNGVDYIQLLYRAVYRRGFGERPIGIFRLVRVVRRRTGPFIQQLGRPADYRRQLRVIRRYERAEQLGHHRTALPFVVSEQRQCRVCAREQGSVPHKLKIQRRVDLFGQPREQIIVDVGRNCAA